MAIGNFEWKRLLRNAFSINDRNHNFSSVLVFLCEANE